VGEFKNIDVKDFSCDPFQKIGKEWMLITAEKNDVVNTMTASWGGMGVLWNHRVVFVFVRAERYTKEFLDDSEDFSVTFYDVEKHRTDLAYLGRVSGRDEDKIARVGFTIEHEDGVPYFAEAETVLLCRKLSRHHVGPEGMVDPKIVPTWYQEGNGYHDMYVGQIVKVLQAE